MSQAHNQDTESKIEAFWKSCREYLPAEDRDASFSSWSFGDSAELSEELLNLVLSGDKTATCGALFDYEADGITPPKQGSYHIVTDFSGTPRCLIQLTQVELCAFKDVSADFAAAEGEGNQSLEVWREGHQAFFERRARDTGNVFDENIMLVLERFKMVYAGS
ncbi:ASCH domain-containing protein [Kiloniella laminariae]|uniref:ASCH domain-containing protein n=1 Tax=Kiloniella laminariae TaxID=454162 RepID=A0ABT4LDR5_9PROT|nr:ASCH domain-containing protein [Kiloniella laminariae]MCZ4279243.1 ASCH domain-containing protein [Kiloniella laminariae]